MQPTNRMTTFLLAVIAVGVWANALTNIKPQPAYAQGIVDVNLAGIGVTLQHLAVGGGGGGPESVNGPYRI